MKKQRQILLATISLLVLPAIFASAAAAQQSVRVEVILVEAGSGGGGVDKALQPYAATLQRLFRFESYRQITRKRISLSVPGTGATGLASGQQLELKANKGGPGGIMADLSWTRGGKGLLHTRIQLRPGSPAVLGGPRTSSGGTHLLILQME